MTPVINAKTTIIQKLIAAAKESYIHQSMVAELESLSTGANPKLIIGICWYDLFAFDKDASNLSYIILFNQLASECN